MRLIRRALPAALLLCGLAHAGLFDDTEARKMISDLQKQIADLQQQNQSLTDRLAKLEHRVDNLKIADLVAQQGAQTDNMNRLRGQLEELQYNIEQTQKRQKDLYVDLDSRLRAIEPGGQAPASADSGAAAAVDKAPSAGEQQTYDAAFNLYKNGNYAGAIAAFKDCLKQFPDGKLGANAQYWTGMSQSALRDYKGAIATQQKLVATWPDSNKAPDALFNIATNQLELGDKKSAKRALDDLVAKYPVSPAADKAKRLLSNIK